jgi:hypothetical protein
MATKRKNVKKTGGNKRSEIIFDRRNLIMS